MGAPPLACVPSPGKRDQAGGKATAEPEFWDLRVPEQGQGQSGSYTDWTAAG